ncbi:unnamed protein product [Arabidopsis halleri]
MARVLAGECSDKNSHAKQDRVEMRFEEGVSVCSGSISNLAHHIPLDLTIEILTRLPAKSLERGTYYSFFGYQSSNANTWLPAAYQSRNDRVRFSCGPCSLLFHPSIVLFVTSFRSSTALHGEPCQEHEVLTIGGGKISWRSIKDRKIPRYIVVTNGICINGMVYYGGLTTRRQEKNCGFFNLTLEVRIGSISTYPPVTNHGSWIIDQLQWEVNCGSAASPVPRAPLGSFDLWVLEKPL